MTKEALLAVIDISINKHRALRDNTSALRKIRNSRLMSSFAAEENVLQQHHVWEKKKTIEGTMFIYGDIKTQSLSR